MAFTTTQGKRFGRRQCSDGAPEASRLARGMRPARGMRRACYLSSLSLIFLLGCGQKGDPYGAVTGVVTFEGQPVPNAMLVFECQEMELTVTAEADEQGVYEARRSAEMPGLPPGTYRVAITPPMFYPGIGSMGKPKAPPTRTDIPARYRDVATSRETVVVQDGGATEFDIDMKR